MTKISCASDSLIVPRAQAWFNLIYPNYEFAIIKFQNVDRGAHNFDHDHNAFKCQSCVNRGIEHIIDHYHNAFMC